MADLNVRVGQKVETQDGKQGTVRYIGPLHVASGEWLGLELPDDTGKNEREPLARIGPAAEVAPLGRRRDFDHVAGRRSGLASGREALEKAALAELHARKPDRVLATNVEFWSAVVLDLAEVPPDLFTPMFTCARVAGWSAHILEQKREAKLIRPSAKYVGHGPRSVAEVE